MFAGPRTGDCAMNDQPKRRPNRKRQLAGVLLVWLICYPVSLGPYMYALGREWVPEWAHRVARLYYYPAALVLWSDRRGPAPVDSWRRWVIECANRGERDRQQR
jgi:hypothetical protein